MSLDLKIIKIGYGTTQNKESFWFRSTRLCWQMILNYYYILFFILKNRIKIKTETRIED